MTNQELNDLLNRWEELREQGRDVSAEEMCRDSPQLLGELKAMIDELRRVDSFMADAPTNDGREELTLAGVGVALEEFVKQLEDSGVISRGKLENFLPPKASPKDSGELARQLVESKQLTKYQAREIGRGRAKSLILGNYTILDRIGAGGMGQVFKAEHRRMHRIVAIKVLPRSAVNSAPSAARFQREVEAAAKLSHPNIVAAFDADDANGIHFLAMEYVEGTDLSALVKKNGPLSVDTAIDYVLQVARGLAYAHGERIVHRDIKPANLLLDKKGTVKILDMGLARIEADIDAATHAELTGTGAVMGTVDYMAPEQGVNTKIADARADIYSLGCTLHYLLLGKPAYGGESVTAKLLAHHHQPIPNLCKLRADVPVELQTVFSRMVAKKPDNRYQSAREIVAVLELLEASISARAIPVAARHSIETNTEANSGAPTVPDGETTTTASEPTVKTAETTVRREAPVPVPSPKPAAPTKADAALRAIRSFWHSSSPNRKKSLVAAASLLSLAILVALAVSLRRHDGPSADRTNQTDGLVGSPVRAADEPAIFTGLVPDDAFAAAVLYPKRVLANEALAKFAFTSVAEDWEKEVGVSPFEVEQFAVVVGPPLDGDRHRNRHRDPMIEIIGRLSKPHDGAKLAALWIRSAKMEEGEMAGHKYFHTEMTDRPGVCFLDDRTFVVASQPWLPKIFASKDAKSMLISALEANDPTADATIILTDKAGGPEVIADAISSDPLPDPLKPLGDLPDLLRTANLTIRTNPEISLKLALVAKDESSADKLVETIKKVTLMGQFMLSKISPSAATPPGGEREAEEFAVALAKKLVDGIVPRKTGAQVTVQIDDLASPAQIVGKLVMPLIAAPHRGPRSTTARMTNIRQLGLGMLNSESGRNRFPAHAIYSKDGKPLLSWRVSLLPMLEESNLYRQFHLDEPWDSENNKPLIAKMPAIFKSRDGAPLPEGKTRFVVPVGKGTIFEGDQGITMSSITDGTSQTIQILEVGPDKAVTWTKPDDLDFDPQKPLANLGTIGEGGIMAVFADGHCLLIPKAIDAESFRRLIIRNDGKYVDPDRL